MCCCSGREQQRHHFQVAFVAPFLPSAANDGQLVKYSTLKAVESETVAGISLSVCVLHRQSDSKSSSIGALAISHVLSNDASNGFLASPSFFLLLSYADGYN